MHERARQILGPTMEPVTEIVVYLTPFCLHTLSAANLTTKLFLLYIYDSVD